MITTKHLAAALGFAYVAAWIGFGFGYALLCLVGAGAFYYAAAYLAGELDLGQLGERLTPSQSTPTRGPTRPGTRVR